MPHKLDIVNSQSIGFDSTGCLDQKMVFSSIDGDLLRVENDLVASRDKFSNQLFVPVYFSPSLGQWFSFLSCILERKGENIWFFNSHGGKFCQHEYLMQDGLLLSSKRKDLIVSFSPVFIVSISEPKLDVVALPFWNFIEDFGVYFSFDFRVFEVSIFNGEHV